MTSVIEVSSLCATQAETVSTAICAARLVGKANSPVLIPHSATRFEPSVLAGRLSACSSSGPTVWMICGEGRQQPLVVTASLMGRSLPLASITSKHFCRSLGPANEWITLSMHLCGGWKQPSICELAALAMAVTSSAKVVMSPCQSFSCTLCFPSRYRVALAGIEDPLVNMRCLRRWVKMLSMSLSKSSGSGGCGERMQSSCLRRWSCSQDSCKLSDVSSM